MTHHARRRPHETDAGAIDGAGKGWLNDGGDTRKAQMKAWRRGLAARAMALLPANKKMRNMAARWRRWGRRLSGAGLQTLSGLADPAVHPPSRPSP